MFLKTVLEDPGGPYLIIDLYPFDFDDPKTRGIEDPPWLEWSSPHPSGQADAQVGLLSDERVFGVILKTWDGAAYGYADWFIRNFKKLAELVGDRRGQSFILGGYLFSEFFADVVSEASGYLRALEAAGWGVGDMVPMIDVEDGNASHPNRLASSAQIVDHVSKVAEWLFARTGRRPALYGRGALRDRSIESKMGCDRVIDPSYTKHMVLNGLVGALPNGRPAPWALDEVIGWQYGGDGTGDNRATGLPLKIAGHKIDVTVAIEGAKKPTLASTIRRFTAATL